ncbi:RsiV family protein [Nosocomiicoccus massiliensis]|uniref:RsiV family protein n=1 Tax=Nosocomiicoccus massiliensis TaxID=1232430 RepID=UPI000420B618|nr:RsiV family protein [Nosocomiicoccus massiliensis]
MKRFGLFSLFMIFAFILAGCSSTNEPVKLKHGVVYKEHSNNQDFDDLKFVANDYDVEIHYPHFGVERIDKKIESARNKEFEDFIDIVKDDDEYMDSSLKIVFNAHDVRGDIYMFNITRVVNLSKDTEYSIHGVLVVNTASGEAVVSDNLFNIGQPTREALFKRLDKSIRDNPAYAPYYDAKKLEDRTMDISKTFSNVDFKGDVVQFHYDQNEIGSSAMGTPNVEIPFRDVIEFLEPTIKAVVEGELIPTNED